MVAKSSSAAVSQIPEIKIRKNLVHEVSDGISFPTPSKVKQCFKEECDINFILQKYAQTGILPDLIKSNPQYGDFADPSSYQDALNCVLHAQEQFAALDAPVRDRFSNDPEKFLAFASNPANGKELVRMGLAVARTQVSPPVDPKEAAVPKTAT